MKQTAQFQNLITDHDHFFVFVKLFVEPADQIEPVQFLMQIFCLQMFIRDLFGILKFCTFQIAQIDLLVIFCR